MINAPLLLLVELVNQLYLGSKISLTISHKLVVNYKSSFCNHDVLIIGYPKLP